MIPSRQVLYSFSENIGKKTISRKGIPRKEGVKWGLKNYKLLVTLFFTMLSFSGLSYHIYYSTSTYLQYDIQSSIEVQVDKVLQSPQLTLCFDHLELIDWKSVKEKYEDKFFMEKKDVRQSIDLQLTLQDLIDFSPPSNSILKQCRIRLNDSYLTKKYNGTDCMKFLDIAKHVRLGYVCYKIELRPDLMTKQPVEFSHHYVRNSFISPGMLFEVIMSDTFYSISYFTALVYAPKFFGEVDTTFTIHSSRSCRFLNMFYVSFDVKRNYLLPPPFAASCRVYDMESKRLFSKDICLNSCMATSSGKRFARLPLETTLHEYTVLEPYLYNLSFLPLYLFENNSFLREFSIMEEECIHRCRFPDCMTVYYATRLLTREKSSDFVVRLVSKLFYEF